MVHVNISMHLLEMSPKDLNITCMILQKVESFVGRNFRKIASFSVISESLHLRNCSYQAIRESLYPQNFLNAPYVSMGKQKRHPPPSDRVSKWLIDAYQNYNYSKKRIITVVPRVYNHELFKNCDFRGSLHTLNFFTHHSRKLSPQNLNLTMGFRDSL